MSRNILKILRAVNHLARCSSNSKIDFKSKVLSSKTINDRSKYLKKYSQKYLMRSCSEYISREWFSLRKINQYPKIKPDNFRSQPSEKQIDNDLEIDRKIFSKYYFVRDCNSPLSKINQNTSQNKAKENLNFLSKKKHSRKRTTFPLEKYPF